MKYIILYWAQITIVIAAIGYLLKVILEHRYKKKEIWHSIYAQKKIDLLLKYWEEYYQLESKTLGALSVSKTLEYHEFSNCEELDTLILVNYQSKSRITLSQLKLFLNKTEYDTLCGAQIQLSKQIQKFINLLQQSIQNKVSKLEFEKLYTETLHIIKQTDDQIFALKF